MTDQEKVEALSDMTNRDHAGRHFTERYDDATLAALEADGLISITRPVHDQTGLPYDQQHWRLEVTQDGQDFFDNHPEFHPQD